MLPVYDKGRKRREEKSVKKRAIGTMSALLCVSLLAGCGTDPKEEILIEPSHKESTEKSSKNQGITYNKVVYQTISDSEIPISLKEKMEKKKGERGYLTYKNKDGLYIYIASGQKNSGGYDIKVSSIEDVEGITNVFIKEFAPKEGMITTQVITYPSIVVKATGATNKVNVYESSENEPGGSLREL
jgi:PrcB C-terminal